MNDLERKKQHEKFIAECYKIIHSVNDGSTVTNTDGYIQIGMAKNDKKFV